MPVIVSCAAAPPYVSAEAAEGQADVYFEAADAQGSSGTETAEEFIPGSGEIFLEDPAAAAGEIIIEETGDEPASASGEDDDKSAAVSADGDAADEGSGGQDDARKSGNTAASA
ncbi:MAG: hypothetical protein Q4G47_04990, partial [Lachnospiraceae bacterium]|nr:hypothetical protein [Lachnospiraceae bacterium]